MGSFVADMMRKPVRKQSQTFIVDVTARSLSENTKKRGMKVVEQFQKLEIRPKILIFSWFSSWAPNLTMKQVWKQGQNFMVNVIFRDLSIGAKKTRKKVVEQFQKFEILQKMPIFSWFSSWVRNLTMKQVWKQGQHFMVNVTFRDLSNDGKKMWRKVVEQVQKSEIRQNAHFSMIFSSGPAFDHEASSEAKPKFYGKYSLSRSIYWSEESVWESCGTGPKVRNTTKNAHFSWHSTWAPSLVKKQVLKQS